MWENISFTLQLGNNTSRVMEIIILGQDSTKCSKNVKTPFKSFSEQILLIGVRIDLSYWVFYSDEGYQCINMELSGVTSSDITHQIFINTKIIADILSIRTVFSTFNLYEYV